MSTTPTSAQRGLWRRWLDFWFAPGDPTTLGFIRIVTGCLALYVHLAYSFDLQSFFGPQGWYGLEYVNRERRELPHVVTPLSWETPEPPAYVPEYPHRKKAVLQYIHSLTENRSRAEVERSLAYLDDLQRTGNNEAVQMGVYYISQLAAVSDGQDRKKQLAVLVDESKRREMEKSTVPDLRIPPTPEFVERMPAAERTKLAEHAEAFFQSLPQGSDDAARSARGYIYSHFNELSLPQRAAFIAYLKELPTLDPAERARRLDYLEYWHQDSDEVHRFGNPIFSIWFHVTDPVGMTVVHSVVLVILFLFTVGFCTRVTSVLAWLAAISYIHRTQQVLFGMDTMMNILLFYLMIGNSGAAMSVDRVINRYRAVRASLRRSGALDSATLAYLEKPPLSVTAGFAQRLIQVHFCFIYMASGLSKLKGPAWWNTNAYWDTLVNPEFTLIHYQWYESLIREMASGRVMFAVAAAGAVAFTFIAEIGLPFLVWTRMRPYIVIMGFLLHAGIAVFMGLWIFSLLMMTLLLCYLPGKAIRDRIFGTHSDGKRLSLRFNSRSDPQARAVALAKAMDFDGRVEMVPVESTQTAVRVVGDGRETTGQAAAATLFGMLNWLRPVRWLLAVPGLGGAISRAFTGESAANRPPVSQTQVPTAS